MLKEIQENILYQSSIDTMIQFCQTNKEIRKNCTSDHFWIELYKKYHIPLFTGIKYDDTFNGYLSHFIHSYNSFIFADYLSRQLHINFTLHFDCQAINEIAGLLTLLKIPYQLPKNINQEHIKSGYINVIVKFHQGMYQLSLMTFDKFKIKNIASLTYNQYVLFLYGLIETDVFAYHYMYKFCQYSYDKHQSVYDLPLYII
jgi:hypothetical protein